jgi:cytochrome c oxidase cbb3-type subunit 3
MHIRWPAPSKEHDRKPMKPSTEGQAGPAAHRRPSRPVMILCGVFALVCLVAAGWWLQRRVALEHAMVAASVETVAADPRFAALADSIAPGVYAHNCASCHGADMKGDQSKGAPNLVDAVWLYDRGEVGDIERMVLYGARAGIGKSRNITDMPAVGRLKVMNNAEIADVVEYVVQLSGRPADAAAAERGKALFLDKGNCYDCHVGDGRGNPDYGSTDFTANTWLYGGDRATLFKSVRDGRHGIMPAYIGTLSPAQIRALAIYVYRRSHPDKPGG